MARVRTMQSGDTYPPLKGLASDQDGFVPLAEADSLRALLKSSGAIITLPATVIDPPEVVDAGTANEEHYNWEAPFTDGDTDVPGEYLLQLEVTWDTGQVEKFPSAQGDAPIVVIEQGNA